MQSPSPRHPVRPRNFALTLGTLAIGAYFSFGVLGYNAAKALSVPSYDIYAFFYPNVLYWKKALELGHGLLWNPYQNCGQPFFADPQTALLYPLNFLFLIATADIALPTFIALHLAISGIASYLFCRLIGLSRIAAATGAMAFELGGNTLCLASWMPTLIASYAWFPVAVYKAEQVLRGGSRRDMSILAFCLAVQLFAGFPQISLFTIQFILLRAAWVIITRGVRPLQAIRVLPGLFLSLLLAAVQLFPTLEFVDASVRSRSLSPSESDILTTTWSGFRELTAARRTGPGTTLTLLTSAFAGLALIRGDRRRNAAFFASITVFFFCLAFDTPLATIYRSLPFGSAFRYPDRFLWPAAFGFSVLVALGIDAIESADRRRLGIVTDVGGGLVGVAGYLYLVNGPLQGWEQGLLGSLLLVLATKHAPSLAGGLLDKTKLQLTAAALVLLNLLLLSTTPFLGLLPNISNTLARSHDAFEYLANHATLNERAYQLGTHDDFAIMPKSSMIYRVRGTGDYQPLVSRRYADLNLRMLFGAATPFSADNINPLYFLSGRLPQNPSLVNLVSTRYFLVEASMDQMPASRLPFTRIAEFGNLHLYKNDDALPRAFFVPQASVVSAPATRLAWLASPRFSPRDFALLDSAPEDGFLGTPGAMGTADILRDEAEELTLASFATAPGFVFLSDQHYPGWEVTVNGVPAPILLANHAFRLVRVPEGQSEIVFRYRPNSLTIGAIVSAIGFIVAISLLILPQQKSH